MFEYEVFFSDGTTLRFFGNGPDIYVGGSDVERIYNWTTHRWTWIRD